MDMENVRADINQKIDNLLNRSLVQRLWESYTNDIRVLMNWQTDGLCSHDDVTSALELIIPKLLLFKKNGKMERALRRAEFIILHKVLEDINSDKSVSVERDPISQKYGEMGTQNADKSMEVN